MESKDLKVGMIFEGKKPKKIGFWEQFYDDRQIIHVSQNKCLAGYNKKLNLSQDFLDWCKKDGKSPSTSNELIYELSGESAKSLEPIWDYMIQYDSPSVKDGKHYPSISAKKFLKWAGKEVTDIMPKGEWRKV